MNEIRKQNRKKRRQVDDNEFESVDFSKKIEDILISLDFDSSPEIDTNEVAFRIPVSGSITSKAIEFLNWCGHVTPPHNSPRGA
jgi:hypothetical protein